jgi:glycosyltransferase involved in cell wall biosynthesis
MVTDTAISKEVCPLVSVVMATYNMARFIREAIDSVFAQTYPNWELQVIDDGSTDETRTLVAPYLSDPRVRYQYQENHGQTRAKNTGIRASRGDFIGFLDADDLWLPKKLELQLDLFRHNPSAAIVYSPYFCIDTDRIPLPTHIPRLFRGQISGRLLIENCVGFCSVLVKRQCFDTLGVFDETYRMGIDYELWLRFSTRYRFDYLREPTALYRIWPGQMSKNMELRYQSGISIMSRFLAHNPHLIEPKIVQEAWAHTYTGRGLYYATIKGSGWRACRDYLIALWHKPNYAPAWRGLLRILAFPSYHLGA